MRKSHVPRENLMSFHFWVPPTRKSPVSCLMRKSHVLSVWGPLPMRKSPVSFLMRKSHVPRENLMSYQFWVPPNEKISCLLSHEKISCLKRKSHVFSVLGPPNEKISGLLSHEKISCPKRKSHVFSVLGYPLQ